MRTGVIADNLAASAPGTTAENWNGFAEYTIAYLTTLCTSLPSGAADGSAASAGAWDPPRPDGLTDSDWTIYSLDPATGPPQDIATSCGELKQYIAAALSEEMGDGYAVNYVGTTAEDWNAFVDYAGAYLTNLCARLPSGAAKPSARVPASASSTDRA